MLMRKFRLLLAQPTTDYYAWQTEVFLHNALGMGYNGNLIDVVGAYSDDGIPQSWLVLQQAFPYVRFFFYREDMSVKNYPPAVQANVLKKHFTAHPYLKDDAIFFCDCDFVFTKYFDFTPYLQDDKWYFSNTVSYVGAKYIESKGTLTVAEDVPDGKGGFVTIQKGLLDKMCEVVGICACVPRARNDVSGGAQKLMKNLTPEYWDEVETDAVNLYNWLLNEKDKFSSTGSNDIQIWTASMWSELWNAWKHGNEVVVPKEFDFAFATDDVAKWDHCSFFHNAGVTDSKRRMFYKASYINKYPYGDILDINPNKCSFKYYEMIQEVGKKSVLI